MILLIAMTFSGLETGHLNSLQDISDSPSVMAKLFIFRNYEWQ